jgi:hypothetical protein
MVPVNPRNQTAQLGVVQESHVSANVGSAQQSQPEKSGGLGIWFVGLAMLIGVAIVSFLIANHALVETTKEHDEADEYEIIEG